MKEQRYVTLIRVLCIISWFLWGSVFFLIGPDELGVASVMLFLTTFGASLFTSFILLLFYIRIRLLARTPLFREFHAIVRESALLTLFFILSLWTFRLGVANILIFTLLFSLCVLIDFFFIYDRQRSQEHTKD